MLAWILNARMMVNTSHSCRCFLQCAAFVWQIKVSNSALISAFMTELEADSSVTQVVLLLFIWLLSKAACVIFHWTIFGFWFFCRVIMTGWSCQAVHLWRGIWNFWLNAWMICQWSSRRWGAFDFLPLLLHLCDLDFDNITWVFLLQFQYYYRNLSRHQAQQQAWLQKRR